MTLTQRLQLIADRLRAAGHPDIVSVNVLGDRAIRAHQTDGSDNYLQVAHVAKTGDKTPERPTWPGYPGWRK